MPERIDLVKFLGSKNYFSLLNLLRIKYETRLGVGGLATYRVRLAIEEGVFDSIDEIKSNTWGIHIEDIENIFYVTGFDQQIIISNNKMIQNWTLCPVQPIILQCHGSNISIEFGQNAVTSGGPIKGVSVVLSYPIYIKIADDIDIWSALDILNRVRLFFSLLMGRVLATEKILMRLLIDERPHDMQLHGLRRTSKAENPSNPIFKVKNPEDLAKMLDQWLLKFDNIKDSIHLYMDGLEQFDISNQLRFQFFVQSIEALHRKTTSPIGPQIDRVPVLEALRNKGIAEDIVDRVNGILAHAHEPGLRHRLRYYWDIFSTELAMLNPEIKKSKFVHRVVSTRNYYAHRMDADQSILEGVDLWDYTEIVKAIAQMSLLREIGAETNGIGQIMLTERFIQFIIKDNSG